MKKGLEYADELPFRDKILLQKGVSSDDTKLYLTGEILILELLWVWSHTFIAITPRSTLTQSRSRLLEYLLGSNLWSNRTVQSFTKNYY